MIEEIKTFETRKEELIKKGKAKGFITVAARVSRAYFDERMCYSREQ